MINAVLQRQEQLEADNKQLRAEQATIKDDIIKIKQVQVKIKDEWKQNYESTQFKLDKVLQLLELGNNLNML